MSTIPLGERLKVSLSAIVCFVVVSVFLFSVPVLFGLTLWVLLAVLLLALVLAMSLNGALWVLFGKKKNRSLMKPVAGFFCLLTIATALPVYYLMYKAQSDPPLLPQATLSNGNKTVVFQGMERMGMARFYNAVAYDLEEAIRDGYRLYYEGVQASSSEGDDGFAVLFSGAGGRPNNHKALADACGVTHQRDYFDLMARSTQPHPDGHVKADVSSLELKKEYDRLMGADPAFAEQMRDRARSPSSASDDWVTALLGWHAAATEKQKKRFGVLCRGVLALAQQHRGENPSRPLDKVWLDFRNRKLVERIHTDASQRIYIVYGAAHLPGVLAALKAKDPGWKIITLKWLNGLGEPKYPDGSG